MNEVGIEAGIEVGIKVGIERSAERNEEMGEEASKKSKVIFIIAHKYVRGYPTYTKYYVDTIKRFYENSLIVIVDNNSVAKEDVFDTLKDYENVMLLENNIECKFEIGAYQVAMKYLIENNLFVGNEYCVFSQDNFVIKNRFDFDSVLGQNNVTACAVNGYHQDGACAITVRHVLTTLGMYDNFDKIDFCWCNTFIIHSKHIFQLYEYFKKIVITVREQSSASERYLARILWELNGQKACNSVDGNKMKLPYDCWTVNLLEDQKTFFAKRVQQKNETTREV